MDGIELALGVGFASLGAYVLLTTRKLAEKWEREGHEARTRLFLETRGAEGGRDLSQRLARGIAFSRDSTRRNHRGASLTPERHLIAGRTCRRVHVSKELIDINGVVRG
jgi:hypothetical protein